MTDKEYVLSLCPEAYCGSSVYTEPVRYYIVGVGNPSWSIPMFDSEEKAWEATRETLNKMILRKFAQ